MTIDCICAGKKHFELMSTCCKTDDVIWHLWLSER